MFSPYYRRARSRDSSADPRRHFGVNIALETPTKSRWVMTELGAAAARRTGTSLVLGRNRVERRGLGLDIELNDYSAPWGRPVRGRVRLRPRGAGGLGDPIRLDAAGRHAWFPIVPTADVTVELDEPRLQFVGTGYHDANRGSEPLEDAFARWSWCRAPTREGAAVIYDVQTRSGSRRDHAFLFAPDGSRKPLVLGPEHHRLEPTRWGMPRSSRCAPGASPSVRETWFDSPFYARSLVELPVAGERTTAMHESLDLSRFCHPVVQFLLPFRMRKRR